MNAELSQVVLRCHFSAQTLETMNIIEDAATPALPENHVKILNDPAIRAHEALAAACQARNLPSAPQFLPSSDLSLCDVLCDLRGRWASCAEELASAVQSAAACAAQVRSHGGGRFLLLNYTPMWLKEVAWPTLLVAEPKKTWVPVAESTPQRARTHLSLGSELAWAIAPDDIVCWRLLRALVARELGASPALVAAAYKDFYRGTIIADRDPGRRSVKEALNALAKEAQEATTTASHAAI